MYSGFCNPRTQEVSGLCVSVLQVLYVFLVLQPENPRGLFVEAEDSGCIVNFKLRSTTQERQYSTPVTFSKAWLARATSSHFSYARFGNKATYIPSGNHSTPRALVQIRLDRSANKRAQSTVYIVTLLVCQGESQWGEIQLESIPTGKQTSTRCRL